MNILVEILGKQFKVDKGDKIKVPYININIYKFGPYYECISGNIRKTI